MVIGKALPPSGGEGESSSGLLDALLVSDGPLFVMRLLLARCIFDVSMWLEQSWRYGPSACDETHVQDVPVLIYLGTDAHASVSCEVNDCKHRCRGSEGTPVTGVARIQVAPKSIGHRIRVDQASVRPELTCLIVIVVRLDEAFGKEKKRQQ